MNSLRGSPDPEGKNLTHYGATVRCVLENQVRPKEIPELA